MKKLLLASLFVIGTTSFAGVEGSAKSTSIPVQMRGNLVANNSANLIIEGTTEGMAGNIMDFDFGDIIISKDAAAPSKSQILKGTWKVWRPSGNVADTDSVQIFLNEMEGQNTSIKNQITATADSLAVYGTVEGRLNLLGTKKMDGAAIESISGTLTAQLENIVATETPGSFVWNGGQITVIIP